MRFGWRRGRLRQKNAAIAIAMSGALRGGLATTGACANPSSTPEQYADVSEFFFSKSRNFSNHSKIGDRNRGGSNLRKPKGGKISTNFQGLLKLTPFYRDFLEDPQFNSGVKRVQVFKGQLSGRVPPPPF